MKNLFKFDIQTKPQSQISKKKKFNLNKKFQVKLLFFFCSKHLNFIGKFDFFSKISFQINFHWPIRVFFDK